MNKPVPDEPFPQTNDATGFEGRLEQYFGELNRKMIRNVSLLAAGVVGCAAVLCWRFAPQQVRGVPKGFGGMVRYVKDCDDVSNHMY